MMMVTAMTSDPSMGWCRLEAPTVKAVTAMSSPAVTDIATWVRMRMAMSERVAPRARRRAMCRVWVVLATKVVVVGQQSSSFRILSNWHSRMTWAWTPPPRFRNS